MAKLVLPPRTCERDGCGKEFVPWRRDMRFCSKACYTAAHKSPKSAARGDAAPAAPAAEEAAVLVPVAAFLGGQPDLLPEMREEVNAAILTLRAELEPLLTVPRPPERTDDACERAVDLSSGGSLRLTISCNVLGLSGRERELVFAMLSLVDEYESGEGQVWQKGSVRRAS